MRNLLFILAFMLMGNFAFANNNVEESTLAYQHETVFTLKAQKSLTKTKCYVEAVDDFGNVYYAQVPCPKVIILTNSQDN